MTENPQAFPTSGYYGDAGNFARPKEGMTLRDYFAAAALAGLLPRSWDTENTSDAEIIEQWGKSAYAVADSLLKARAS